MPWGPWRCGAPHVLVGGCLEREVDVDPCLCGYGHTSHASSSFADASARHMGTRSLRRCIRVQRCFSLFITFRVNMNDMPPLLWGMVVVFLKT
jgi:hypothetical protein